MSNPAGTTGRPGRVGEPDTLDTRCPALWDGFRRALTVHGERPALRSGDRTLSYAELAAAVAFAARRLTDAGVEAGDRVVLLTEPGLSFPVYDLAFMAVGAVRVPLNPQVPATEVASVVERVSPAAVVVSPSLRHLVAESAVPPVLDDLIDGDGSSPLPALGAAGPRDPAFMFFTGGTTGKPKGILHTQYGMVTCFWAHVLEGEMQHDERLLLTTPLPHAAGLFLLAALLRGAYVRIEPRFDPNRVIELVDEDRITWTFAVPTMIYRLLDAAEERDWRPTTLRTVQYGAAPITPVRLRQALERFGAIFQQLYAQAECPNYGTVLRKDDHVRALVEEPLLRSCGRPSVFTDVTVRGEDGEEVPAGATGEVCLRSPYTMERYWDDPGAFAERYYGRWLRTGDIGHQDDEGYVFLVDRRNDMIISGGMNVYSLEVEAALAKFPGVGAVAVIGVPHEDWGEAVQATIVPHGELDLDALDQHARANLAAYKRPKSYELVDSLPLTVYGKVDKKALRAPHWQGQDRGVH